jgi:hypothetical protein
VTRAAHTTTPLLHLHFTRRSGGAEELRFFESACARQMLVAVVASVERFREELFQIQSQCRGHTFEVPLHVFSE